MEAPVTASTPLECTTFKLAASHRSQPLAGTNAPAYRAYRLLQVHIAGALDTQYNTGYIIHYSRRDGFMRVSL